MQRVTVLCVGKLKEKFYLEAAAEYVKRLQRFCKLELVELPESRLPESPSPAEVQRALAAEAVRRLKALPGVEVFTPANGPHPTGVVSFRAAGRDCEELAEALGRRGIALRAGLHCAPLAHRTAGTLDTGTVRLSLSDFNTPAQIEKLAQELHQLFRETVR